MIDRFMLKFEIQIMNNVKRSNMSIHADHQF